MSTRSQIRFVVKTKYRVKTDKVKTTKETGLTYRHSDGYPEGILPDLIEFLKWNGFRNNDLEYTAANWMFFGKRSNEHYLADSVFRKDDKKPFDWQNGWKDAHPNISMLHTGYGICFDNKIHSDIEYYYEVIHEYDQTLDRDEGNVKCEIHCYRTEHAQRKANGDYDFNAPKKIQATPFAKVIFKPGDYKYEIQNLEGLDKNFKEPEEITA